MKLKQKKLRKYAVVVPLVALAAVAIGLIVTHHTSQAPQQVFDDMLAQNLSTDKFRKNTTTKASGEVLNQEITVNLSAQRVLWLTSASHGKNHVTTESIGTPDSGYVRYLSVKDTAITSSAEDKFQKTLYKWFKSDGNDSLSKLYTQALVDVNSAPLPPLGRTDGKSKKQLLDFMSQRQIFKTDSTHAKTVSYHGHAAYQYSVAVNQADYIRLMQKFVKAIGVKSNVSDFDAGKLANAPAVSIELTVDKSSHRLLAASYPKAHYKVTYDYAVNQSFSLPKESMPASRLQQLAAQ